MQVGLDRPIPQGCNFSAEEIKALVETLAVWHKLANRLRKPLMVNLDGLLRSEIDVLDYFVVEEGQLTRSIDDEGELYRIVLSSRVAQNISWIPTAKDLAVGLRPFATLQTLHPTFDDLENMWSCSWADVVIQIPHEHLLQTAAFSVKPARTVEEPAPMWRYGEAQLFCRV